MMYCYIVVEGERIVGSWKTEWDSYSTDQNIPERKTIRVSEDEYNDLHDKLGHYRYRNKVIKKDAQEIKKMNDERKSSPLIVLQNKVSELEKKLDK